VALRELQLELKNHLRGEPSRIFEEVVDSPPLPVDERLGIYRNAYRVRLIEALDEAYPVLHAILGDDMFYALGEAYVTAHPSPFRSIRWYGGELAEFLSETEPYEEQPILAEVALLEWTLTEVFDAADAPLVTRADLGAVPPQAWQDLRLGFHPSVRRLSLFWNTAAVWSALSREEGPPDPQASDAPVIWLLWRQSRKNLFRSIEPIEAAALDAAINGASFGELCEVLGEWLPPEEIPLAAANYLNNWVLSDMIVTLESG
jgi:hypothetical protein